MMGNEIRTKKKNNPPKKKRKRNLEKEKVSTASGIMPQGGRNAVVAGMKGVLL